MSDQRFADVTRAGASGFVMDGRLRIADAAPVSPGWFPCDSYLIGGSSVVVIGEPLRTSALPAVVGADLPDWASALVLSSVLTPDPDPRPMIEVELVRPAGVAPAAVAFCAACAASDAEFTAAGQVDAVVRVGDRPVRVRASLDPTRGWSGVVSELTESERAAAERWRVFRPVDLLPEWGGWDGRAFRRSERGPYDLAGLLPYYVVSLDDHDIAVVIDPTTPRHRRALESASPPAGCDALVVGRLATAPDAPTARLDALLIRPADVDRATVAAVLAAGCALGAGLDVVPDHFVVEVNGEQLAVIMESDVDHGRPLWSFRTRPA